MPVKQFHRLPELIEVLPHKPYAGQTYALVAVEHLDQMHEDGYVVCPNSPSFSVFGHAAFIMELGKPIPGMRAESTKIPYHVDRAFDELQLEWEARLEAQTQTEPSAATPAPKSSPRRAAVAQS